MAPYDRDTAMKRRAMANILAGQPNAPWEPEQGMFGLNATGRALARGGAAGGMIGGAVGGPVGALAGAAIGAGINRLRMGTPSDQAQAALDGGWDGFSAQPSAQGGSQQQPARPQGGWIQGSPDPNRQELFPDGQPVRSYAELQASGGNNNLTAKKDQWAGMRQATPLKDGSGSALDAARSGWKAIFG